MITWISTRIGKLLAGLALVMSLLATAYVVGRRDTKLKGRIDDLEEYQETRRKIDEVHRSPDADAAFERLRRNGWLR